MKLMILAVCYLVCLFVVTAKENNGALTFVKTGDNSDTNEEKIVPLTHYIDKSAGEFIPTDQWQKIKEGQAIPAGLHVRLNLETGEREAKLLEGYIGFNRYWKTRDREGMFNKDNNKIADEGL